MLKPSDLFKISEIEELVGIKNMEHYICKGGCSGVSPKPGTCEAEDCQSFNEPLESCDCEDNKHYGTFEKFDEKEENEVE